MTDPYKILGVSPDATDDEVKEAYRKLVKKYHPDKFADSDLAELANEKMKEINSAYDEIQQMRSGKKASSSGAYGNGGFRTGESSSSEFYTKIRRFINMNNIFEAEQMLNSVPDVEKNAEWNYLYACVMVRKGFFADAQRYFDKACEMDPSNQEFQATREQFRARGANYNKRYRTVGNADCCDCCTSLMCADCCCECMGGDLIPCC